MVWLALLVAVFAADPVPDPAPADGTIVVWGDRDPVVVRAELDAQLKKMGFPVGIRVGNKMIYTSLRAGYGRVEVWDDGRVRVIVPAMALQTITPQRGELARAGPPDMPGIGTGGTVQPPTTIGPMFAVNGRRAAMKRQADLTEALAPKVREWNDAIADVALRERLLVVLGGLHDDWEGPGDAPTRRARIAARWLATADSPAGAKVRAAIRSFVATVVTPSGEGFTPAEIGSLEARRLFPDDWAGVSPPGRPVWTPPPPAMASWVRMFKPGAPLVLSGLELLPPEMLQPRELGLVGD